MRAEVEWVPDHGLRPKAPSYDQGLMPGARALSTVKAVVILGVNPMEGATSAPFYYLEQKSMSFRRALVCVGL
jgi:hypothetical protein